MSDLHNNKCQLVGGIFAILVQVCLAFVCITTLVIKRLQEVPRRDWFVWFLDATKQGLGSSFGHFSNIYLSVVIAQSLPAADECQWYCTTYVLDATIGTACNLLLLSFFTSAVRRFPDCRENMIPGEYGNPPQLSLYLPQLAVWLVIVVIGKIFLLLSISQVIVPVDSFLSEIFRPLRQVPELELVIVMIMIPTLLNSIQFWVTDSFLKRSNDEGCDDKEAITEMTGLRDSSLDEDLLEDGHDNAEVRRESFSSRKQQEGVRGAIDESIQSTATSVVSRLAALWPALFPGSFRRSYSHVNPNRNQNSARKVYHNDQRKSTRHSVTEVLSSSV